MMPENFGEKHVFKTFSDVAKAKSHYNDTLEIQINYDFLLKSHYYDARKY